MEFNPGHGKIRKFENYTRVEWYLCYKNKIDLKTGKKNLPKFIFHCTTKVILNSCFGCWVFRWRIRFLPENQINIPERNYYILCTGVAASLQKLGIILENKMFYTFSLSKNVNNKKCAPKLVSFIGKKNWFILQNSLSFHNRRSLQWALFLQHVDVASPWQGQAYVFLAPKGWESEHSFKVLFVTVKVT